MKKITILLTCICVLIIFPSCDKTKSGIWLVPNDEVRDGGPGKDGIPSIDSPEFASVMETNYLVDEDLIIGIKIGNEIRGYTHEVLDYHEIVNDEIGSDQFAVTYCPLTGTAIGWDRVINGRATTFGVSGLLYNSNLIPYDRATDSNWSQMRLDCVNGELINTNIDTYPLIETDWLTWQKFFPDSKVITTNTGFSRNYGQYPYGGYKDSERLIFDVSPMDDRLSAKERVLGVIVNDVAKVYRFDTFSSDPVVIVEDEFEGQQYIVVGSKRDNYMVAYRNTIDGQLLQFTPIQNNRHMLMEDNEGNQWNIFGEAISGPRQGQQLEAMVNYIGYWFSLGAFYPGAEIFE